MVSANERGGVGFKSLEEDDKGDSEEVDGEFLGAFVVTKLLCVLIISYWNDHGFSFGESCGVVVDV